MTNENSDLRTRVEHHPDRTVEWRGDEEWMGLEEAIERGTLIDIIKREDPNEDRIKMLEDRIRDNPGYYCPGTKRAKGASSICDYGLARRRDYHQDESQEAKELSDKCVLSVVDMREWLDVFGEVLEDPEKIKKYVEHLDPKLQEKYEECREVSAIQELIGTWNNIDIFWDSDKEDQDKILEYFKEEVMPMFRRYLDEEERRMEDEYGSPTMIHKEISDDSSPIFGFRWHYFDNDDIDSFRGLDMGALNLPDQRNEEVTERDMENYRALRETLQKLSECPYIDELYLQRGDFEGAAYLVGTKEPLNLDDRIERGER